MSGVWERITPSAARLTTSLRDIGYDFTSAVADLVDNSISAGARDVGIQIEFDGAASRVFITDNGRGMSAVGVGEALRFGSRRDYERVDLGRYGLGLKTASLSQGRSLTVCSRIMLGTNRVAVRTLDLDEILSCDDWLIFDPGHNVQTVRARRWLQESTGTVVIWEKLDRVLPSQRPDGGWARRRFEAYTERTAAHLSMVFHRFIEGTASGRQVTITVNGEKLLPWSPFAEGEPHTQQLALQRFEVSTTDGAGTVELRRYVLPPRERFSSVEEFERLSGPLKWNRQQGLYIYRADRLVQWGGWAGVRAIDEHTKLARAALNFGTDLDEQFHINVAKMRVNLPPELRQMLTQPLHELSQRAEEAYRLTPKRPAPESGHLESGPTRQLIGAASLGLALRSAAAQAGEYSALRRIFTKLNETDPEAAAALGF